MSEMLAISPLESSDLKPARHPATLHTKKPLVPLTVIGEEGTAKRNIIRKGGLVKARKECAPGKFLNFIWMSTLSSEMVSNNSTVLHENRFSDG